MKYKCKIKKFISKDYCKPNVQSWINTMIVPLFFLFFFFMNTGNSVLKDFYTNSYNLTINYALFTDLFLIGNLISLTLAVFILKNFNTRYVMLIVGAIETLCVASLIIFKNQYTAITSIFIIGTSQSFNFLSIIRITTHCFAPEKSALPTGVTFTIGLTGGALSNPILKYTSDNYGGVACLWIFFGLALFGFLMYALFFRQSALTYNINENDLEARKSSKLVSWKSFKDGLKNYGKIIIKKNNWLIGLYIAICNIPLVIICFGEGLDFFKQQFNFGDTQNSIVVVLFFVGLILGSPVIGFFADWLKNKKLALIIPMVIMLVASGLLFIPKTPAVLVYIWIFLISFSSAVNNIGWSLVFNFNDPKLSNQTLGTTATLFMACSAITEPAYVWIKDSSNETIGFLILPIVFAIALIMALMSKTKLHVQQVKEEDVKSSDENKEKKQLNAK